MSTLDDFYARQRPDGYIQRVYSGANGAEARFQQVTDERLAEGKPVSPAFLLAALLWGQVEKALRVDPAEWREVTFY